MRQRVRSAAIAVTGWWFVIVAPSAAARAAVAVARRCMPSSGTAKIGPLAGDAAARAERAASSRLRWPAASVASWGTMARLKRSVSAA